MIYLKDCKIIVHRNNVDCMTNPPDIIEMIHLPTNTNVWAEYKPDDRLFLKGYLFAKLEDKVANI